MRLAIESGRPVTHLAAEHQLRAQLLRRWASGWGPRRANGILSASSLLSRTSSTRADPNDPVHRHGAKRRGKPWRTTTADHHVLASVGPVGDAYDNALAESFVDTFKAELIKDRVWQTRSQLELAILEYVDWFNNRRLHPSLPGQRAGRITRSTSAPDLADRT